MSILIRGGVLPCALVLAFAGGCTSSQVNAVGKDEAKTGEHARNARRAECANFKQVIVTQQTPVWCWAASAEMVHKFYGRNDITQELLARKITLVSSDDPDKARAAGLQEIMVALNPDYEKRVAEQAGEQVLNGGEMKLDVVDFALGQMAPWSATSDDLIDAITTSNPAIVGLRGQGQSMGHAVVVYALTYEQTKAKSDVGSKIFGAILKAGAAEQGIREDQVDATGITRGPAKYALHEIEYADPMDGKRYKLNAEGFKNRVDFIMTKDRARDILDRQLNAVR